jgi:RNA polymerase sigma-70 factor (ECF subfamily)
MSQTFADLVEEARRGDRGALEDLLQSQLPGLRAYVRLRSGALLRAKESTSDLVQSICREALLDLSSFSGSHENVFRQWLYSIAYRKILDRHRFFTADRRAAARERPIRSGASASTDQGLLQCYATLCTPSREAEAREEIARIERAFDALPDDYREVLTLARIVGLSHREIAERLGRGEEAVRKLLSRARARLAILLARPGD